MKRPHWINLISINFYWHSIDLGHCLNLNVISPNSTLALSLYVALEVFTRAEYIIHVEVLLNHYIVHADLANYKMELLSPIQLIRNCSK